MKCNINELTMLATLLNQCKNDKDLKNPSTVISGIRLTKSIHASVKSFYEDQSEIFKAFNIEEKEDNGSKSYSWEDKSTEDKEKINNALVELSKTTYEVEYLNRIDEEDFVLYTKGLNNSEIVYLYDFLVIKE